MKYIIITLAVQTILIAAIKAQSKEGKMDHFPMSGYNIIKVESRIPGLSLAIMHKEPQAPSNNHAVLFIHGASFPSDLAFGFRMSNYSWIDNLAEIGYDVYALDFLGYGNSDRYPEIRAVSAMGKPLGRACDIYKDIDIAVNTILEKTGTEKVSLIAHSWGGSVAALYATKFPEKIAKLVLFSAITTRQDTSSYKEAEHMYQVMTPEERVNGMRSLTPEGETCQLEPEVLEIWGKIWLQSDPLAKNSNTGVVKFPAGFDPDVEDLLHGKSYYDPAGITAPTLIIRGEWDTYPNNADAECLFRSLTNAPHKKYVVIGKGTHVMHLEKSRHQLYDEVRHFLSLGSRSAKKNSQAIAVIFEVVSNSDQRQTYLNLAESLKSELGKIPGFISIERFQSISQPEKMLSLSFWENEEAIRQWRNLEIHRSAQVEGREYVFKDYRLRVAQVIRDYGMFDRDEAPKDSKTFHNDSSDKQ